MPKVYISPSDQFSNTYAVGNTNEAVQCRAIAKFLDAALKRCGIESKANTTAGGNNGMYERAKESNEWGADLHLPIHTNAFDGKVKGTRLMAHDLKGEGYKACKAIMETLAPITPGTSDSITARPGLVEVKNTNAPCAYIEVAFHDNSEEAQWIIDHKEDIAEAICKGLCNFYKMKYVPPKATDKPAGEKPATENIYRVFNAAGKQVGAYIVEANAFNEVKKQLLAGGSAKITYGAK